jgi:cell division FtsZ-interacting protein ZapD
LLANGSKLKQFSVSPDSARVITYEYPFNERIRTLLRLEDLFEKTAYFTQSDGRWNTTRRSSTLFEILEVAGRADLKMDLIQELERQRQTLLAFATTPKFPKKPCPARCTKSNSRRPPCSA